MLTLSSRIVPTVSLFQRVPYRTPLSIIPYLEQNSFSSEESEFLHLGRRHRYDRVVLLLRRVRNQSVLARLRLQNRRRELLLLLCLFVLAPKIQSYFKFKENDYGM